MFKMSLGERSSDSIFAASTWRRGEHQDLIQIFLGHKIELVIMTSIFQVEVEEWSGGERNGEVAGEEVEERGEREVQQQVEQVQVVFVC